MRKYLVLVAAASLIFFMGCTHRVSLPKETAITLPPGQIDATLGPSHKRIDFSSPKTGRRFLSIDVYEDERQIQLRREQHQPLYIRNP